MPARNYRALMQRESLLNVDPEAQCQGESFHGSLIKLASHRPDFVDGQGDQLIRHDEGPRPKTVARIRFDRNTKILGLIDNESGQRA